MKFVLPDLRAGENVFYWQEDQSKIQQGRKSGKWLKVEIIDVKRPHVVHCSGALFLLILLSEGRVQAISILRR